MLQLDGDDGKGTGRSAVIRGEDFWDGHVTAGMRETTVGGRTVVTFDPLPDSPYAMLVETAGRFAAKTALHAGDGRSFTYGRLIRIVDALADRWSAAGVGRGSRVGLLVDNSMEFVACFLAANSLGAVTVPLPTKFREGDLLPLIAASRLDLMVCEERFSPWPLGEWSAARREVVPEDPSERDRQWEALLRGHPGSRRTPVLHDPEDLAVLLFTSGTTSTAKRVMISNFNIAHAVVGFERTLGLTAEDSSIIAIPICNVTGMVGLLSLLVKVGATMYLEPRFRAARFASLVAQERITFIHGSPTVFRLLLEERPRIGSLPSVRLVVCGAAHASQPLIHAMRDWMPNMSFRTAWGMTETTSIGTLLPVDALAEGDPGSCGVPSPGLRVRILGDDGREVVAGGRGEIVVAGPSVAMGYEGPGKGIDGSGWLRTGDIGFATDDGRIHVVGRTKDVVNRGGEKVACAEVEEELERLPGVAGAAVVGVPDDLYGEVPVAAVVLEGDYGLDVDRARSVLATRLAHYKVPSRIVVVDRLPLTAGMKLDKRAIRETILASSR